MKTKFKMILFLAPVFLISNLSLAKTPAKESDFVKWWKSRDRDTCIKLNQIKPLQKTSSLDLPESKFPLKVMKITELSYGNIVLVGEDAGKISSGKTGKSWIGIDSRNRWTPIEVSINGTEVYGAEEIDICIFKRKNETYLDITTNGPACVPSQLYQVKDPAVIKISDNCGG